MVAQQHWRELDSLVLPAPIAHHPALELVNTFSGWDGAHESDYLARYDHLVVLAGAVGVVPEDDVGSLRSAAAADPAAATRALERARDVRAVIRDAVLEPHSAAAVAALTEAARSGAATLSLVPGDHPAWRVLGTGPTDLDRPTDAFAWAAAELVTRGAVDRVRSCPGRGCGWTFLDTSGRRRWCSMRWCGNRSKVRAHAQRRRPSSTRGPGPRGGE